MSIPMLAHRKLCKMQLKPHIEEKLYTHIHIHERERERESVENQ